ncbi:MAG: geranylfarnesyl diphosphate synthase [Halobacteriales archaeon]
MTANSRDERVLEAVRERRELVNDAIPTHLPIEEPERLYEAARYLLDAGGKRLRPTVVLLVAESITETPPLSQPYESFPDLDGEPRNIMKAAVAIEIIQSFTLIHDDIMDDDDLRRGVAAVHKNYDTETAILAGDTLYSKAFEILLRTGSPPDRTVRAIEVLAETCTEICEGQSLDVAFEDRPDVLLDEYLDMIERKTAVLYGASAATPAILLGADTETVEAMYHYGIDIGKAFQIHDDILDLTVPSEKLGKQRGSDLIENKKTLITVHAQDQGVDITSMLADETTDSVSEAAIDEAVAELERVGSIEYARETAHDLVEHGKSRLNVLPESESRTRLKEIADYLIERGY